MVRYTRRGALILGLWLSACGDADLKDAPGGEGPSGSGDDQTPQGDGDGGDGDALPPEMEERSHFEAPRAGKTVVYVPNPVTHRVAVVNAQTFAIETVRTGKLPTYASTVPGQDTALVLNVGSGDAALLRTVDGHTTAKRIEVGHEANAIAVAPGGQHAVLFYDAAASSGLASTFQDVTVVDLSVGKESSRGVSVGFHPRSVQFSASGSHAFIVTDDGVSIVDLMAASAGPTVARLVSVGDKLSDPVSNDVQVTADGKFALARRDGDASLRLVDLESGVVHTLDLHTLQPAEGDGGTGNADGGSALLPSGTLELTDVDLAPDSSFALAVIRNLGTVLRIPIPSGFADLSSIDARVIEEQRVGSVAMSASGKLAVLYTTAEPAEGVVVLDLSSDAPPRGVRLRKSVRNVLVSDDGSRALVLHARAEGSADDETATEDERIDRSEGYSLVDTQTGFAKLKLTSASVAAHDILITPGAERMFALLRDDARGVRAYETADLRSFEVQAQALSDAPSSLGLVPAADRVFIGQESEGGMISFLDAQTGELVRPVAGFELVSGIRE